MLLVTINEWGSTMSIQIIIFFPKQASFSCIYNNPIMVLRFWTSATSEIEWRDSSLFVHSHWRQSDTHISFPASPLPLSLPLSLCLSPIHTYKHTLTLQMPRRWRRSPYCLLPRAAGSAGRRGRSCAGRVGPAAEAGSTSSGKLPAEAAASAGWPAASLPLSPPQSVSWVDGETKREQTRI